MFKPCVGMVVDNEYRLIRPLGEGGMGIVFEAVDSRGRQIALKFLKLEAAGEHKRFQQEGAILQRLQHPNLIKCFGTGQEKGVAYLALEYFDGRSLAEVLRDEALSTLQRLHIATQLNEVLYYIHCNKIGHRDIRPDNVLVCLTSQIPLAKLVDFGIVRDRGSKDRMTLNAGQLLGAVTHLPPESFSNRHMPSDRNLVAADLYGLGLTLVELFTGKDPFAEIQPQLLLEARFHGLEVSVNINTGFTPLDDLLRALIDSEPVNRPRYEDIREALNSVPDHAWLAYVRETEQRRSSFPGARASFQTQLSIEAPRRPSPPPPLRPVRIVPAPPQAVAAQAAAVSFDLAVEPQAVSSARPRSGARPIDPALLRLRAGFPALDQDPFQTDPGSRPASLPGAPQQPLPTLGQWLASAPIVFWLVLASLGIPISVVGVVVIIRALLRLF